MDERAHSRGRPEESPRSPGQDDLARLCAELNRVGARYLVVGGFAIIEAGFPRLTQDVDLLVDAAPENEARIFEALRSLPDRAVDELAPGDLARFTAEATAADRLPGLAPASPWWLTSGGIRILETQTSLPSGKIWRLLLRGLRGF